MFSTETLNETSLKKLISEKILLVISIVLIFLSFANLIAFISSFKNLGKAKNKKVLPVVKANAYGHGVNVIVPVLYKSGQRDFAVARYVEAENILKMNLGNDIRILVFESIRDMELIKGTPNIDIAINSMEEFKEAIDAGIEPSRMQLKIDFGFGRNGIYASEAKELREYILERIIEL